MGFRGVRNSGAVLLEIDPAVLLTGGNDKCIELALEPPQRRHRLVVGFGGGQPRPDDDLGPRARFRRRARPRPWRRCARRVGLRPRSRRSSRAGIAGARRRSARCHAPWARSRPSLGRATQSRPERAWSSPARQRDPTPGGRAFTSAARVESCVCSRRPCEACLRHDAGTTERAAERAPLLNTCNVAASRSTASAEMTEGASASLLSNVIPPKAGTHASLHEHDACACVPPL